MSEARIRAPRPGDLGWCAGLHGRHYAEIAGFGLDFEAVARLRFFILASAAQGRGVGARFGFVRVAEEDDRSWGPVVREERYALWFAP